MLDRAFIGSSCRALFLPLAWPTVESASMGCGQASDRVISPVSRTKFPPNRQGLQGLPMKRPGFGFHPIWNLVQGKLCSIRVFFFKMRCVETRSRLKRPASVGQKRQSAQASQVSLLQKGPRTAVRDVSKLSNVESI